MERIKIFFWTLFGIDVVLTALLLLIIFAILSALGAFAAGIVEWPVFTCLFLILCAAISGLVVSRKYPTAGVRRAGFTVHGLALGACLLVVFCIGWMWFHAVRRRFLLPSGFEGEVYLLHVRSGAAPGQKTWWRTTYHVPADGLAATIDPAPSPGQSYIDEYDYVQPDGHLLELQDVGPGTLPDTPENRNDHSRVYTYFPRYGGDGDTNKCLMGYDEISIGTKAYLLSPHRSTDLESYFAKHPELCAK
jgi:hypothetical protein